MGIAGFIALILIVPVITIDARERESRDERPDRNDITTEPAPTPVPYPLPLPEPTPIIIPQETLEEWKEDIEAGDIEKVIEEYTDIIEGNVQDDDQVEGDGEEPDTFAPRTRTIRRVRNGDTVETTPSPDESQIEDTEVDGGDPLPTEDGEDGEELSYIEMVAAEIHRLTNIEREKAGVPILVDDSALGDIAQAHSEDMALNNYFSHTNLLGCNPACRLAQAGYDALAWGENIAWRSSTVLPPPEELALMVVVSWMNSSGHRDNMLSENFTHEGVGIAQVENVVFATVDFARPQ